MYCNRADGNFGEETAERFLRKKGYLFIARNYWTDRGEIDLIFYRNFKILFVEVKTRKNSPFGTGREAVDSSKQRRIKESSKIFIRSHCIKNKVPFYVWKIPIYLFYNKIRYDVIEIKVNDKNNYVVNEHLKDYFK